MIQNNKREKSAGKKAYKSYRIIAKSITYICNPKSRREKEAGKKMSEEIIATNFPKLIKNSKPHFKELQKTPSRG